MRQFIALLIMGYSSLGMTYMESNVPSHLSMVPLAKKAYPGKRISLNFQHINIKAVLKILADFTGINIIVGDKVEGNITLRLNDVPWEQALDIILTTQGLDKRKKGNVLLIDTKKNLNDVEKAHFKSQKIIEKLEPVHSELLQVNYAKAADLVLLIRDKKNSLLSLRGKISVDERTNTIWIQDTATKIKEVRRLMKQLDVPVKQVLIEARIVEVSKDFSQDIGIRWGVSRPSSLSDNLTEVNPSQSTAPLAERLNLDLISIPANLVAPASVGIALAKLGDNILLDLELSALESEGRAELISSPRLITINQQAALIESGQEIPYQELTATGSTSVSFRKAVLALRVTPQITPDRKILMDLKINQDTASAQKYNGVPAILTKEIQTKVLVNNGQTIVLGGIYTQGKTQAINRVPFFGELPIVGHLFKNRQVSLKNDELLIFITPKIINNNALSTSNVEDREKEIYK